MDPALIGGLALVGLIWGFAYWLRRKAMKDDYYEREFKSPAILDVWNRGGPGAGA